MASVTGSIAASGVVPGYDPADPQAAPVTERNLLANERFWPYRVALLEPLARDSDAPPIPTGRDGVLLRVEAAGDVLLVDFGRDGRHRIPAARTDIVERANRVRRGEMVKDAPNLVWAIAPRMLDSEPEAPSLYPLERAFEAPGFLAVLADPATEEFEAIARSLAPLRNRSGVVTVLFPYGRMPDQHVHERLKQLEWPVLYLFFHLAEPYGRTLLPDGLEPPAVLLLSREGRLLHQSAWRPGVEAELESALDQWFGESSSPSAAEPSQDSR